MSRVFTIILISLLSISTAVAASPVKARSLSGMGILLISKEHPQLSLFKEPSIGRISEINLSTLPESQSISTSEQFKSAIVTLKKGNWYRILYDDGEREGWIEGRSSYHFYRWEKLLANKEIILTGGLRKEFYLLHRTADSISGTIETLAKGSTLTSLNVEGDWIRVMTASQSQGWLRWRDENSRLVISIKL